MPPPMRATHLSIVHKPLDTRIFRKQCRSLAAAGYDVHLIVGGPPASTIDGVRLHPVSAGCDRPRLRRQWMRALRAALWSWRLRPSVYHLHDPHLIPLGLLLKLAGQTVVYDVHEDYPEHARCKLSARPVRAHVKAGGWAALEWLASRAFDGFVCASPALAPKFPAGRTVVVHNFPLHREFACGPVPLPYRERQNRLVTTGYISELRSFRETARALELLPPDLDCRLRMLGEFRPRQLAVSARSLAAWRMIDLLPWQSQPVVIRELLAARVGAGPAGAPAQSPRSDPLEQAVRVHGRRHPGDRLRPATVAGHRARPRLRPGGRPL
jgi:glycosyltransferase involved in cell wall biosynthesis